MMFRSKLLVWILFKAPFTLLPLIAFVRLLFILCPLGIAASCLATAWLLVHFFQHIQRLYYESSFLGTTEYSWVFRLMLNCMGYATLFVPGVIVYKYLKKTNYFERTSSSKGCISRSLYLFFEEVGERLPESNKAKMESDALRTPMREFLDLATCFTGLMGSYLIWGLLQEKIMTQNYSLDDGTKSKFHDSQFLVFINRLSAFMFSFTRLAVTAQLVHKAPLYKYSFSSFSNIMSAWCQYEALKYVSFPTQVLSKACKIIPVMLMGKVVSNNKYEFYEYVTALMISMGMVFFMFGSSDDYTASTVTTLSGVVLLACYMLFDSFTSNWQTALFKQYAMSPVQMMCGVNLFSCLFTGISLAQQPASYQSFHFLFSNKTFAADCLLLSASSALGQLFIFHTISRFGAIVFTIIMTLRQATAILLSCIVYGHEVSAWGIFGIMLVFFSVFLRVYCKQRLRRIRSRAHV